MYRSGLLGCGDNLDEALLSSKELRDKTDLGGNLQQVHIHQELMNHLQSCVAQTHLAANLAGQGDKLGNRARHNLPMQSTMSNITLSITKSYTPQSSPRRERSRHQL